MIRLARTAVIAVALSTAGACVSPEDDPSNVKDLRVLAISIEPPELMAEDCASALSSRPSYTSEVTLTALIVDPKGNDRQLRYELLACADPNDRNCSNEGDRSVLANGLTPAGELALQIRPGALTLSSSTPLLQRVVDIDDFHGFGGIRMPLVLHLFRGEERIYAQKLMVFNCRMFPEMTANTNPVIPGLSVNGNPWGADSPMPLQGAGQFNLSPEDFTNLEESYVVPAFDLTPVHLRESWKLSWHTDLGTISPTETGGVDLGGQESRHMVEWKPGGGPEQDVDFWVVARDGRGGESWLKRRAHYSP
jgi:hypothetical protein